mmetsp:Transcript_10096/g.19485  ORF Transcript_10096/g.19485 Transcript_10096/m.19485 type:complete len:523 (+) Transcript_10096:169-1737(+)
MSLRSEVAPKSTQLYSKFSTEQQHDFGKVVIDKLRTLIGGYGELNVLAEYIGVMLQSSRPPEQIQSELEAFLQEQSRPFTTWLMDQLAKVTGEDPVAQADASKGEALLLRAVRDARQGNAAAAAANEGVDTVKRRDRTAGERERRSSRHREKRSHAASATAAAADEHPASSRHGGENLRSRSRQRSRRRHRATGGSRTDETALREISGGSAASREAAERKAVLTPNVQFLRDAYHQKAKDEENQARSPAAPPPDGRWQYRADPMTQARFEQPPAPAAMLSPAPPAGGVMAHGPMPVHQNHHMPSPPAATVTAAAYGPPPGMVHSGPTAINRSAEAQHMPPPPTTTSRPKYFPPKKWRVVRANTMVRATEHLSSEEVQVLQEGEIVEQIAPSFKMKNGIIRIQIRHPASPLFPEPVGWVTQDATSAGGPRFLEPGPEPMTRGWRPPASTWNYSPASAPASGWRPRGPPAGPSGGLAPGAAPRGAASHAAQRGPYGFQNMTWKPGSGTDEKPASTVSEVVVVSG